MRQILSNMGEQQWQMKMMAGAVTAAAHVRLRATAIIAATIVATRTTRTLSR